MLKEGEEIQSGITKSEFGAFPDAGGGGEVSFAGVFDQPPLRVVSFLFRKPACVQGVVWKVKTGDEGDADGDHAFDYEQPAPDVLSI